MIICWWSGGITSAVACKLSILVHGAENCRVIMLDTQNEHIDTYRFLRDCEEWYGVEIERVKSDKYVDIEDTWYRHKSLNTATGAICSYMLKRRVREECVKSFRRMESIWEQKELPSFVRLRWLRSGQGGINVFAGLSG